jgi:hypothetical protein
MNDTAIPGLDSEMNDEALKGLGETFWNLCLWEDERRRSLDSKVSALLGLASLAAAVVAIAGRGGEPVLSLQIYARVVSLGFFTLTVGLSLFALLVRSYGSFNDEDVFSSLAAHETPVGDIRPFKDQDAYRCYLRETILQRWLVYRWHCDANDRKAKGVIGAQVSAFLSVLSLFWYIALLLI